MANRLPELERRRRATEKTRLKYIDTEFDWKRWRHCIALARYQAVQLGHKPPPIRAIRSALAAKKELQRRGVESVRDLLDELFPRIAPAQMLLGDLAAVPGEDGLDAVFVCVGPNRLMGWHASKPTLAVVVVDFSEIVGAWRL